MCLPLHRHLSFSHLFSTKPVAILQNTFQFSHSCCRAQAPGQACSVIAAHGLWSLGSVVVAHRLGCFAACGIFPDQGLNPCPLHWPADSYPGPLGQKVAWPGGGTQEQKVMNTDQIRSDQLLSRVQLFATLWTIARQAPLPMGFSRQEYWMGEAERTLITQGEPWWSSG